MSTKTSLYLHQGKVSKTSVLFKIQGNISSEHLDHYEISRQLCHLGQTCHYLFLWHPHFPLDNCHWSFQLEPTWLLLTLLVPPTNAFAAPSFLDCHLQRIIAPGLTLTWRSVEPTWQLDTVVTSPAHLDCCTNLLKEWLMQPRHSFRHPEPMLLAKNSDIQYLVSKTHSLFNTGTNYKPIVIYIGTTIKPTLFLMESDKTGPNHSLFNIGTNY